VTAYNRINARVGSVVNLNMTTLRNGKPQTPYAIREINIYRGSIRPGNIVATIPFPDPDTTNYPFPASEMATGEFIVPFLVPDNFVTCDIYFDVWSFIGTDPGAIGTDPGCIPANDTNLWVSQPGMFWVFDDIWISNDQLKTLRLGFDPLDKQLRGGELRTIEVAVYPLPLHDYDYNVLAPIIPQLSPTITIHSSYDELIIFDAPCRMGIRQGANLNAPYVIQCFIDTRTLVRGMYKYTVKVNIDDKVMISPRFNFTIQ
jgi:hypothetical protein